MSRIIRRTAAALAAAALGITLTATTPATESSAAAERLDYSVGENPRNIGTWQTGTITVDKTWTHKRWPVAKVVRQLQAKGVPVKVGTCPPVVYKSNGDPDYSKTAPCITVSSDRHNDTGPTGKRLGEVSLWSANGLLIAADISLDDRDGKKASKKKRERKLRAYILQAAGR